MLQKISKEIVKTKKNIIFILRIKLNCFYSWFLLLCLEFRFCSLPGIPQNVKDNLSQQFGSRIPKIMAGLLELGRCVCLIGRAICKIIRWLSFHTFRTLPILIGACYLINHIGINIYGMPQIWLEQINQYILKEDFARILYAFESESLGEVVLSIGVTGALFSWLLQIIKDEECGVELSTLFKWKYPKYIQNLWAFIISTGICIYCCAMKECTEPVRLIIVCNVIAMITEVLYMCVMCKAFLFSRARRKEIVHNYLLEKISSAWLNRVGNLYTVDLTHLLKDIESNIDEVYKKVDKRIHFFSSVSNKFKSRFLGYGSIVELFERWIDKSYIDKPSTNNELVSKPIIEMTDKIISMFVKLTPEELVGESTGCLLLAFHKMNIKIDYLNRKSEFAKQRAERNEVFVKEIKGRGYQQDQLLLDKFNTLSQKYHYIEQNCDFAIKRYRLIMMYLNTVYYGLQEKNISKILNNDKSIIEAMQINLEYAIHFFKAVTNCEDGKYIGKIFLTQFLAYIAFKLCNSKNPLSCVINLRSNLMKLCNEWSLQIEEKEAFNIFDNVSYSMNIIRGGLHNSRSTYIDAHKAFTRVIETGSIR